MQEIQLLHNSGYLIYDSSFPFLRCFPIAALKTSANNSYKHNKCGPQHLLSTSCRRHRVTWATWDQCAVYILHPLIPVYLRSGTLIGLLPWSYSLLIPFFGITSQETLCTSQFQDRPSPPPRATPGHLTHVKLRTVGNLITVCDVWLHSSVGRASHRFRGDHGFKSPWSPDFFQASSFQLLKLEIYCDDHSLISSSPPVQIWIISYILHIISLLTGDMMNSTNWPRSQCVAS